MKRFRTVIGFLHLLHATMAVICIILLQHGQGAAETWGKGQGTSSGREEAWTASQIRPYWKNDLKFFKWQTMEKNVPCRRFGKCKCCTAGSRDGNLSHGNNKLWCCSQDDWKVFCHLKMGLNWWGLSASNPARNNSVKSVFCVRRINSYCLRLHINQASSNGKLNREIKTHKNVLQCI